MKKLLLILLFPVFVFGTDQTAHITKVVDGDTVYASLANTIEKIRIIGIDTPEIVASNRPVECFGAEASNYAKLLLPIESEIILSHTNERDRYERLLGYIELSDGSDFGLQMIRDGYAYAYRSFDHERKSDYIAAESIARLQKKGLWADNACRYSEQSIEQTTKAWQGYLSFMEQTIKIIQALFNF